MDGNLLDLNFTPIEIQNRQCLPLCRKERRGKALQIFNIDEIHKHVRSFPHFYQECVQNEY